MDNIMARNEKIRNKLLLEKVLSAPVPVRSRKMGFRTVNVKIVVSCTMKVDEGTEIGDVVDGLDLSSVADTTGNATIEDFVVANHEVMDSH